MSGADRAPDDRLNDYLDDLVAGRASPPPDLDPATAEAVHRFFARDDAPAPPRELAARLWEDLMNASTVAGALPHRSLDLAPSSLNGRWWPRLRPADHLLEEVTRRRGSWLFAQLATAALLLVTLGVGYVAFDPFGAGRRSTPTPSGNGMAATPGSPEAPATASAFDGHPIVGAWRWHPDDGDSIGVFDADGTYVEYSSTRGVGLGKWRPTGEATAELVVVFQSLAVPDGDIFTPGVPEEHTFEPDAVVHRLTLELSPSGVFLNSVGSSEARNSDGTERSSDSRVRRAAMRLVEPEGARFETAPSGTSPVLAVKVVDAADGVTPVGGACLVIAVPEGTAAKICDGGEGDLDPIPGSIEVDGLPAGDYWLEVRAPAGYAAPDDVAFRLAPSQVTELAVALTAAAPSAPPDGGTGSLVVLVLDAADAPLPGACVELNGPDRGGASACDDDFDGVITLDGLPAGDYVLLVSVPPPGYAPTGEVTVWIEASAQAEVVVVLTPESSPSGPPVTPPNQLGFLLIQIVDDAGSPVPGACIELVGPAAYSICDNDASGLDVDPLAGTIELGGLPAGDYLLRVVAPPPGYLPAAETVVSVVPGTTDVVLLVEPFPDGAAQPTPMPVR